VPLRPFFTQFRRICTVRGQPDYLIEQHRTTPRQVSQLLRAGEAGVTLANARGLWGGNGHNHDVQAALPTSASAPVEHVPA
jgi:hypothetical protein